LIREISKLLTSALGHTAYPKELRALKLIKNDCKILEASSSRQVPWSYNKIRRINMS